MTVLLTGASGVVGSAALRALDGQRVVSLVHRKPVTGDIVHGDITRPWLGMHPSDYRDLAAAVDVVVNCAALVNFSATPQRLHEVNVRGVGQLLRFVEDAGARLVHASTAYVTKSAADVTLSAYAHSKATGETLVRESGLPAAIARISTVIGDSHTGEVSRLQTFHFLLGVAMTGQLPFLPGTSETRVDVIATDIAAHALVALTTSDSPSGDYWLTAGPAAQPLSRIIDIGFDIASAYLRETGRSKDVDLDLFRPRLVAPSVCEEVINMVMAGTGPDAEPSVIRHIAGLMAIYHDADKLPTSLGSIPGGPPLPTEDKLDKAVQALCRHLVRMPVETWTL